MKYGVFRNEFVLEKTFDDSKEAEKYRDYCARCYEGSFSVKKMVSGRINYAELARESGFVQAAI